LHFSIITQKNPSDIENVNGERTKKFEKSFISSALPPSFFQKHLYPAPVFCPRKKTGLGSTSLINNYFLINKLI